MITVLKTISSDLGVVAKIIDSLLKGKHSAVVDTYSFLTRTKGKMLRPSLVILSAKVLNEELYKKCEYEVCCIAAVIELLHIASLVHDDVIDEAKMRRGNPTINYRKNNKHAVIVGDIIIAESLKLLLSLNNLELIDSVVTVASSLSEGEIIQEDSISNFNLTLDEYLVIISKKTASLFEISMQLPAIFFGIKNDNIAKYGHLLGLIFQFIDDILDYDSTLDLMGKDEYGDFYESKVTLPIILLKNHINQLEFDKMNSIFGKKSKNQQDLKYCLDLMNKYDISGLCREFVTGYVNDLEVLIDGFDGGLFADILLDLVSFVVSRKY